MKIVYISLVEQLEHCMYTLFPLNVQNNLIYSFSKTEIWSHDENDNTVNMKIAEPDLYNYYYYPELFIVDSDFCTKK